MTSYLFGKFKYISIFFVYIFIPLNPLPANQFRDYLVIDFLTRSCYEDRRSCNEALFKINNYQKEAARNKNFSCQTRLLGLEANLIMVINSNLRRNDAKSIIDAIKKHC